ncbi:hypothetical protein AQUCO_00100303v1 [Aquilegia coerulea]|uniref:Uncharacterized protein n=1 Tax=Aquilegia coerulea TaxID=218851 RepID=A0A2G5F9R4_AQUCA|nr:hypothetical protein AQUCO_00100303v1 [Aquilegia coerulea]
MTCLTRKQKIEFKYKQAIIKINGARNHNKNLLFTLLSLNLSKVHDIKYQQYNTMQCSCSLPLRDQQLSYIKQGSTIQD